MIASLLILLYQRQPLRQISPDIRARLQPHGDPHQPLADPRRRPLLRSQTPVGGGSRVGDGGLHIAQIGGDGEHARSVDHLPGPGPTAAYVERDDAAAALLLPAFPLLFAAFLPGRIQTWAKHPMLLAVILWALAHLIANGNLADVVLFGSFLAWSLTDRISFKWRTAPPVQGAPPGKANDWIALGLGPLLYGAFMGGAHLWLIGVSPLGVR
jgi:hypothetical protein